MSNILSFKKLQKLSRNEKTKAVTMCSSGFHVWKIVTNSRFDVKQGKLVTVEKCEHCNKERVRLK